MENQIIYTGDMYNYVFIQYEYNTIATNDAAT